MHSKTLIKSAILILGASLVASGAWAQAGLGNLAGMVVDIDGRAVSGIRVEAIDVIDPSRVFTATSAPGGSFQMSSVPVGTYQVVPRTANTPWIVKDTTPIVDVDAGGTPNVRITLLRMPEMQSGGGGGASPTATYITLGLAGLASVVGIADLIQTNDLQDDLDALADRTDAGFDQLNDRFNNFQSDFENFRRELGDDVDRINDKLDDLGDKVDDLDDDVKNLQDDFDNFQDDFADFEREVASNFRRR